jgi:predicted nucleic acid-binding protein
VAVISFLTDKSAWEQLRYSEAARLKFAKLVAAGHVAVCTIIVGELLYSARTAEDFLPQRAEYDTLHWMDTGPDCERRALDVMQALALRGQHRGVSLPDLLIAATAEMRGATLLHYDSDFERIAEVTGQPHEWIVPRG